MQKYKEQIIIPIWHNNNEMKCAMCPILVEAAHYQTSLIVKG